MEAIVTEAQGAIQAFVWSKQEKNLRQFQS
jgi:hypothetical protein